MSTSTCTKSTDIIAAAEVWLPNEDGSHWSISEYFHGVHTFLYGDQDAAPQSSLPDLVVENNGSVIASDLSSEFTSRGIEAPADSDVKAALAIPCYSKGNITAITVLFINGGEGVRGAVEIWGGRPGRHELSLRSSYYSKLDFLPHISYHVGFPLGSGLPGKVWETGAPIFIPNLAHSTGFLRSSGAQSDNLEIGLGIPVIDRTELKEVILFLSGNEVLAASNCEVWAKSPSHDNKQLKRYVGWPDTESQLFKEGKDLYFRPGEGLPGRVWAERQPIILSDLTGKVFARKEAAEADNISAAIGIPIFINDDLSSVVLFGITGN